MSTRAENDAKLPFDPQPKQEVLVRARFINRATNKLWSWVRIEGADAPVAVYSNTLVSATEYAKAALDSAEQSLCAECGEPENDRIHNFSPMDDFAPVTAHGFKRAIRAQSEDLPANNQDAEKGGDASVTSEYPSAIPAQRTSYPAEAGTSGELSNAIARVLREHNMVERGSGCGEYVYLVRDIMALIPKQAYRLPATAVQHMMVSLFGPEHDEELVPDAIEYLKDFDVEIIGEPK